MTVVRALDRPPRLLPLFARAVLTSRRHGDSIAAIAYETAEQPIDGEHLAAYQRVCGFRVGDELPVTYLHVLAFPLSVALMVEPDFPFPLIGLVHVANSITTRRPVRLDESLRLRVEAGNLRPHPAGEQLDVVAVASVDGHEVWTSTSTYLRRAATTGSRSRSDRPRSSATPTLIRVPADIGRRYAAIAGDHNPIHLHPLAARAFGFPRAIAHGMWMQARALATLLGRLPDAYTVDAAFKTPVLLPSTVELFATRRGVDWILDVHNARSGKPHLAATIRTVIEP
jgi:hypothetical protein